MKDRFSIPLLEQNDALPSREAILARFRALVLSGSDPEPEPDGDDVGETIDADSDAELDAAVTDDRESHDNPDAGDSSEPSDPDA